MYGSFQSFLFFLLYYAYSSDIDCRMYKKNNEPEPLPSSEYLLIHLKGDSTKIFFNNLPKIDADGEEAIQLPQFVSTTLIPMFEAKDSTLYDSRLLYAYQIVADDGFSASVKGYSDNIWEHLKLGHILTSNRRVIFPDENIDLPGAYNVKETRHIYIYRKFDVIRPDTSLFYELNDMPIVKITNPEGNLENAVQLKNFIEQIVSDPENHQYNIRSLDDFGPSTNMTWTEFQTGYWRLDSLKTMFTDTTLVGGAYRVKVLDKIMVN